MANDIVKFESPVNGQMVSFTADDVRQRLCPGIGDKELALVMALCQAQHLNPFTNDVYLLKYGDKPAKIVTSKEVFTKRAQANPKFDGFEAGITVNNNGKLVRREGSMVLQGEALLGGWCKVYVKGYRVPIYDEVSFAEYTTGNNNWASKPGTMIRKVALCHALREAFPDDFQGLYGSEEMGVEEEPVKDQNHPSEAASEPQSDISEPIVVDAVEVVSDETAQAITDKALELAELRGQSLDDVMAFIIGDNAPEQQRAESVGAMTVEQGTIALDILDKWIAKAKEANPAEEDLADSDIPF